MYYLFYLLSFYWHNAEAELEHVLLSSIRVASVGLKFECSLRNSLNFAWNHSMLVLNFRTFYGYLDVCIVS